MPHNPMIEIVLEKALNALTECQELIANEVVSLEFQIVNIEQHMLKGEKADQYRQRLDKYMKVKEAVDKVIRQGNALDI